MSSIWFVVWASAHLGSTKALTTNIRSYAVRRSSRPSGPYRDQELHWLAAKLGFDTAFGLPFDRLRATLNRRFGSQPRNSCNIFHDPLRIAILLIVLLAFGLRVYHLDAQSFWSDEGLALGYAMRDVPNLVSTVAARFHTPLYFLTLHYWLILVGSSDFAIRFLSFLFSTLAVPLLYRLGKSLFNRKVGALAALIIAINPFQIRYAQEARMYSMVLCLSLSSALLFLTALREDKKMLWGAYALITALSMYAHYYACLVPLFESLFFVISRIRGRYRSLSLPWLASQAAIAVLYSPWLSNILWLTSAEGWQEPISPFSLPWQLLRTYSLGSAIPSEQSAPFALGFLLLTLLGLYAVCTAGGEPGSALFSLLYLLVPLSFTLGVVSTGRGFLEKYLIVITPAYYLILAGGLALFPLKKRMRWPLLVLGALFIGGTNAYALHHYYFDPRFYNPDFRSTAEHIETFSRQGDAILFDGPDPGVVFWHYYNGRLPIYRAPSPSDQKEGEMVNDLLTEIAARHYRLWLVLYFHPPGPVEFWLDTHGFQAYREEFCNVNVYLYSLPDRQAFSQTMKRSPSAQFSGQIELAGYRLFPQRVESGGMVNLALYWRAVSKVREDYKVSVRLSDEAGHLLWMADRQPVDGFSLTSSWVVGEEVTDNYGLLLPPGTMPGRYEIEVMMYDPESGAEQARATLEPLSVIAAPSPPPLGTLKIAHPHRVIFSQWLELLGYEPLLGVINAGETVTLVLFWRALEGIGENYDALLQIQDQVGKVWEEEKIAHDAYPTDRWRAGEVIRILYDLRIDATVPQGRYRLVVNLIDRASGQKLLAAGTALAELKIISRERRFTAPGDIQYPMRADLGDYVTFLGYDLAREVIEPGGSLHLTLYWRARKRLEIGYTVFTHLLDKNERVVAQKDSPPQGGAAPTTSWLEGEVIVDKYEIEVGAHTPPGEHRIEIGMYDAATGQRLPVFSEEGERLPGDRILLETMISIE